MIYKIKRFARADYAGLNKEQAAALREQRDAIAKELAKKRKASNHTLLDAGKERLMDQRSYEHQRFVNQGMLRENRVTKDAMGQIQTRNYFGKKKTHSNEDIQKLMNKDRGFVWEKGARADAHTADVLDARSQAKAARENILKKSNSSVKPKTATTNAAGVNSLKRSVNTRRLIKAGKYAGAAALGAGLGYGAHHLMKNKEE